MNKDIIQGNWTQLKGKALQAWGKLTNDDLDIIDGRQEELVGRLQASYGWTKEEAERRVTDQVAEWEKSSRQ